MSSKKQIKEKIDFNTEPSKQQEISELQEQIKQLQMEVDVKRSIKSAKKDRHQYNGAEKSRKAVIIDAVEEVSLHQLLKCLHGKKQLLLSESCNEAV